jgi:flavin reductase (DIM6/NTAB) family NADH-FMN oxidoreductase RutF
MRCSRNGDGKSFFVGAMAVVFSQRAWLLLDFVRVFILFRERKRSMAFDPQLQRQVMGRFATGVAVVTTCVGEQFSGMTANAVMSLSLDPPLVVVSVDKSASMHGLLQEGQCFAINVLRLDQEELSNRFAQRGPKDFSDLSIKTAESGAPILVDALAYLDCRLVEITAAGDHDMFIGECLSGETGDGAPLIFFGGRYGELTEESVQRAS